MSTPFSQQDYERQKVMFMAWLDDPVNQAELKKVLAGEDADWRGFKSAAVDTITAPYIARKADYNLLRPELRPSLLFALRKAARHGLRPDGKEGALIPRYNSDAKALLIEWQSMIWGVMKLARATGAIKKINARIVYEGEPFEMLGGSDDRIVHRMLPQAMAKGLEYAIGAYAILTAPDGTEMWRFLTRDEIYARKNASSAAKSGNSPWNGPFESEMWIKSVLLYTSKWIELDTASPAARRFMEALGDDLKADFDGPEIEGRPEPEGTPALPPPADRLDRYEDQIFGRNQREKEPVGRGEPSQGHQQQGGQQPQGGREPGGPPPGHPAHDPGPGAPHGGGERARTEPLGQKQEKPPSTAVVQKAATPQDWIRGFQIEAVDPSTSTHALWASVKNIAAQRYLSRIKAGFPDLYDDLKAYVHAKLRALGANDADMKELV